MAERQPRGIRGAEPAAAVNDQADEKRHRRQPQDHRQKVAGQPVGRALERRLVLEGPGRQLDDPADDGVLGDAPGLDGQRPPASPPRA